MAKRTGEAVLANVPAAETKLKRKKREIKENPRPEEAIIKIIKLTILMKCGKAFTK
jgi:hypothetical protein